MRLITAIVLLLGVAGVTSSNDECSHFDCGLAFPICPPDSLLIKHPAKPGECCPSETTCECDEAHCAELAVKCAPGTERIRVRKGTKKPGQCCDQFECRHQVHYCDPDACPKPNEIFDLHTLADNSCPNDSFRPPSYVPIDECCLVVPDCRCKASICEPVRCSSNEVVVVDSKGDGVPGRCCDKFHCKLKSSQSHCVVDGVYYSDGDQWNSDSCESCSCVNGVKLCRKMDCQSVIEHCSWVGVPEGSCCPICLGCSDDNEKQRNVGDSWVKDDCTNCTCDESFKSSCQRSLCKVECDNPRKVEGQCCPVCDQPLVVETPSVCASIELCTLRCKFGLLRNQWGCFECQCAEAPQKANDEENFRLTFEVSSPDCPQLNAQNCKKQCAHGYLRDLNNCPTCKCAKCPLTDQCYKQCLYGFETDSFGCNICKCRVKSIIDNRLNVGEVTVQNVHDVCLSRNKQTGQFVERDSGEWWSDSYCRQCFCEKSTEFCSLITCPCRPNDCPVENWTLRAGDCCPSCNLHSLTHQQPNEHFLTVCHSPGNGRLFVDGKTWKLDECISCTCRVGHVLCSAKQCPPIACENPIEDPTDPCCKTCPDSISNANPANAGFCIDKLGTSHSILSTWREDDCHSCACDENGAVRCYEEKCSQLDSNCTDRALMVKGRCCAVCLDSFSVGNFCTYKDSIYGLNEKFYDGHCRSCTCKSRGIVECVEKQCSYCAEPVYSSNSCCPVCQEDKNAYLLEGSGQTIFLHNQFGYFLQPMTIYLLLIGLALLVLCTCVICSVVLGKCFNRRKKSLKLEKSKSSARTSNGLSKRNVSECESASVSLLSSSDTNNVSLSPAISLIVQADKDTIPSLPGERFLTVPSRLI